MGKITIGSKVKLLDQVGEGIVTGYTSDKRVLVLMSDGFEIPYFEKELVSISTGASESTSTSLSSSNVASPLIGKSTMQDAVYMAFALNGIVKDYPLIDVQLVNRRKEAVQFVLYSESEKIFHLEERGEILGGQSKSIIKIVLPELLSKDRFFIQLQPFSNQPDVPTISWSGFIKHQTQQVIEPSGWPMIDELSTRAMLIQVYPDKGNNIQVARNKESENAGKMLKASQEWLLKEGRDGRFEVDLHIEELLDNTAGMDNAEIIRFQLRYFDKCLDEARKRPVKRFVAIHGVGKGRLRDEIRKVLSAEDIEHYDAPLSKYGYGATEIIIR
ncbi:MAG: Smr/MutS family protein [Bacteroidia bacterium]